MQNKSAIQLMIKWIIANPDVTHAERISKAMEFRDAEENGLRERVRELEDGLYKIANNRFDGLDAIEIATDLLTKPDSTGGWEKEVN